MIKRSIDPLLKSRGFTEDSKIISPIWIKAVRDFQSKSKTERDSYCLICGCTGGCNLCDDISKYRISEQLKYYK